MAFEGDLIHLIVGCFGAIQHAKGTPTANHMYVDMQTYMHTYWHIQKYGRWGGQREKAIHVFNWLWGSVERSVYLATAGGKKEWTKANLCSSSSTLDICT